MKIGYQLKQVRERLAKGLVDKGILRTEKRNFLLFDMATHPVADGGAKEEIRRRVRNVLTQRTVVCQRVNSSPKTSNSDTSGQLLWYVQHTLPMFLRMLLLLLGHEARERAFAQVDELLAEYSQWPFGKRAGGASGVGANLGQVISEEVSNGKDKELQLEVSFNKSFDAMNINLQFLGGCSMSQCLHETGLPAIGVRGALIVRGSLWGRKYFYIVLIMDNCPQNTRANLLDLLPRRNGVG
jgi:hypothetical protein